MVGLLLEYLVEALVKLRYELAYLLLRCEITGSTAGIAATLDLDVLPLAGFIVSALHHALTDLVEGYLLAELTRVRNVITYRFIHRHDFDRLFVDLRDVLVL